MIEVNFCRAPSHNWVGWCEYENGMYYSAGKTLDNLLHRIKGNLYASKRVSGRQIFLASKQSTADDAPIERMTAMFKTKFWYDRNEFGDFVVPKQVEKPVPKPLPEPKGDLDYDYYDTVSTGEELIVYGILRKEVARYKLNPNNMVLPTAAPTQLPKTTPFGCPQQPFEPQVRYDNCINNAVEEAPKATAKWKPRPDIPTE